jgi:hypothetical protein
MGRHMLAGQQRSEPQNLPDAPQPVASVPGQDLPVQEPPPPSNIPSGDRSGEGVRQNQGKRSNRRPGFPPVSPPAPGGMPVPLAARPNVLGARPECVADASSNAERFMSCQQNIPIFNRFLDTSAPLPLTPKQKAILAARNVIDWGNLATIGGLSALTIMTDSHTADGPGFPGFAKNAGVSLSQDMTGEFFSTFLIPSLAHQDPHYHRMPNLSVSRRILHVLDAVVIAQSDQGLPMFNYATVVGTLCTNTLGNVYVPGRKHSFGASAARISTSLATDPIGNALTEFVPDLARHVNIQVVIVQRIINRVAIAEGGTSQE